MIRWMTSGESHGSCLTGILDGIPAGLAIDENYLNDHLKRRQKGYGRSERMRIPDRVEIVSGLYRGITTGAPITLVIRHLHESEILPGKEEVWVPRPGHADAIGRQKYDLPDIRPVIERASARETAMRVALGSIARKWLEEFSIVIASHVIQIGPIRISDAIFAAPKNARDILKFSDTSDLHVLDKEAEETMIRQIEKTHIDGDTLGGIVEILIDGLPAGLGSYRQSDQRLGGLLMQAIGSIPGCKGVEIGDGFEIATQRGSVCADGYEVTEQGVLRLSNHAGGLEGGMSNGEQVVLRAAVKPVPTLRRTQPSYDIRTKLPVSAHYERADTCVVTAFGVICEAMVALTLMNPFLEKFGGDSLGETRTNWQQWQQGLNRK